jgi:hypothetical protein
MTSRMSRGVLPLLALGFAPAALGGTPTTFAPGSIVVPMDRDLQDDGILDAYGLVYELLRQGVPVRWVIDSGKVRDGDDLVGVRTHLTTETSTNAVARDFRGGPFVIDSADAAAAEPIIAAWQGAGHAAVAYFTDASATGEVSHTMFAAPSIIIYADGNEDIAWDYLNSAGIPDLDGNAWDRNSPYNVTDTEIAGPDDTIGGDGILFDDEGFTQYCHLNAMHYDDTSRSAVTSEFRAFAEDPLTSTLTECEAAASTENEPLFGHMLSAGDLVKVGLNRGSSVVTVDDPGSELIQIDGPWELIDGSLPDFVGTFNPNVEFVRADDGTDQSMLVAYGFLDDDVTKGKVSFLGGHHYTTDLPYTTHDQIQGVRVFLNSYFTARCTALEDRPIVALDGDPVPDSLTIDLELDWSNTGVIRGRDSTLVLQLPPGISYVSDDSGGVYDAGTNTVTWDLGTMSSGESDAIHLVLTAATDGDYDLSAEITYRVEATFFAEDWAETVTVALDSDGDHVSDVDEGTDGTDPHDADTDDDGLDDGEEIPLGTDPLDADTDDDGLGDGNEVDGGTSPTNDDSDGDGLGDGVESGVDTGVPGGTSDGDGTPYGGTDGTFTGDGDSGATTTDPNDPDSDGDGISDGDEDLDHDGTFDGDQSGTANDETDPNDSDSDNDGLNDLVEGGPGGPDADADGTIDALDPDAAVDTDGDGLGDTVEEDLGTDPTDADTDDDGIDDGDEVLIDQTDPVDADTDDDGIADGDEATYGTDPNDGDSDGDGIDDGTEVGVTDGVPDGTSDDGTPYEGTDPTVFDGDGDGGTTTTDPTDPDTDGDGLGDGNEDGDQDGVVDSDETDPNNPDTDGDGLGDGVETGVGDADDGDTTTDPLDADTDGDGISDGDEDLNHDGAFDGDQPGTGDDETDPNDADSDDDGLTDFGEGGPGGPDSDSDGTIDALDPDQPVDTDGDGISDPVEDDLGTDPTDADTDDDGVDDGDELTGTDPTDPLDADSDDDGLSDGDEGTLGTDPNDADTDDDGLGDGLEAGVDEPIPGGTSDDGTAYGGTDGDFVGDGDGGDTTTDPTDADTDGDGILDGDEDLDRDGVYDGDLPGTDDDETDPNDADSDDDGANDLDEGGPGGPDADGDDTIDALDPDTTGDTGDTGGGDTGSDTDGSDTDQGPGDFVIQGGACKGCASDGSSTAPAAGLLLGSLLVARRRRQARP